MLSNNLFMEYSPYESFSKKGRGRVDKKLCWKDRGSDIHDVDIWEIGNEAYSILTEEFQQEPTDEELFNGWKEVVEIAQEIHAFIVKRHSSGNLKIRTPDNHIMDAREVRHYLSHEPEPSQIDGVLNVMNQIVEGNEAAKNYDEATIYALLCLIVIDAMSICKLLESPDIMGLARDALDYLSNAKKLKAIKSTISKTAQKAAQKRHEENHQLRDEAIEIYKNGGFKSAEEAARHIITQLPVKHRTVTGWITKYLNSLRADCTPCKDKE